MQRSCDEKLLHYNQNNPKSMMNLVLFKSAIKHVLRIIRIVSTPLGHALLIGMGGSGRNSLATLSCYIVKFAIVQIDPKNWVEELQVLMLWIIWETYDPL